MLYDKDIREPLFEFLETTYGKIRILEEKQMGRTPGENPKLNWKKKLSLLWRPELAHIQELNQMPGYREKSKQFVTEKILLKVPKETLRLQISEELFERDYTRIAEIIQEYRRQRTKPGKKRRRR